MKSYQEIITKWKQNEPHTPSEEYLMDLILELFDEIQNLQELIK